MTDNDIYVPFDYVIFTPLDEEESALLNVNNKKYYSLNDTGTLIWESITQERTVNEMIEVLVAEYDVNEEEARLEIKRFTDELLKEKLVYIETND